MDIDYLCNILGEYFQQIDRVSGFDNIIRCERKYKDIPYEIYYFDISSNFIKESFDLNTYLDELLTKDYYSNPSCLQWNYYLVFLNESDSNIEHNRKKIERNEVFARKFVIDIDKLSGWLGNKYCINNSYEETFDTQDLSIIWINKLKEYDLDCVYLNETYVDGIKNYINGKPIKEHEDIEYQKSGSECEKVSRIKKIHLINYRKLPTKKDFDFGRVNLFIGKNGVGKTSLLEAIELFTCGKNFRNPEEICKSISINVLYEDEDDFTKIDLKNNSKYRMRDYFWYHNFYKQRNKLYLSFNRFNFYNTDAASQLSDDKYSSPETLKDALNSIALGMNVNILEQKMKGYCDRFESKIKEYDKHLSKYRQVIEQENAAIKKIVDSDKNPELLFDKFIHETQNLNWVGVLPNNYGNDDIAVFETELVKVRYNLRTVLDEVDWMENPTIKSLNLEMQYLKQVQEENNSIYQKTTNINYEIKKLNEECTKLDNKINLLTKLKKYYLNEEVSQLIGLDENIRQLVVKKSNYEEAISIFQLVDLEWYASHYGNIIIEKLIEILDTKILDAESRKSSIEIKIDKLEKNMSKIEKIISEIKSKGNELILVHPNVQNCPLCNSSFEKGELRIRIETTNYNIDTSIISKTMEELLGENLKLIEEIKVSKEDCNNLKSIRSAIRLLNNNSDFINYKLFDVINLLEISKQEILDINGKLNDLKLLKKRLNSNGYFEKEYNNIIKEIKSKGITTSDISLSYLDNEIRKQEQRSIKINFELSINSDEIKRQNFLSHELANTISKNLNPDDLDQLIFNRMNKINLSLNLLADVSKVIKVSEDFSIKELKNRIELLYEIFKNFNNEKKEKERIDTAIGISKSKIEEHSNLIKNLETKQKLAIKGHSKIKEILEQNSKDIYLEGFLKANKQEILRIFSIIHSPKEFINFDFDSTGIFLERANSEIATLSKISTGQRSALALSIFLTLNKKLRNGPEYIIFDDPIAHVDDLNALSFFDYLREVVVNTERQVFFATANENLAFLFYQKFNFIGDSQFKTYRLTS